MQLSTSPMHLPQTRTGASSDFLVDPWKSQQSGRRSGSCLMPFCKTWDQTCGSLWPLALLIAPSVEEYPANPSLAVKLQDRWMTGTPVFHSYRRGRVWLACNSSSSIQTRNDFSNIVGSSGCPGPLSSQDNTNEGAAEVRWLTGLHDRRCHL